jgi:hypothetical protein
VNIVDQDQVAGEQRRHHRTRGNLERLDDEERSRNTARITGNRPAVQSSHQGCISRRSRAFGSTVSTCVIALLRQIGLALRQRALERMRRLAPARQEIEALRHPVQPGHQRGEKQQQREVAFDAPKYQAPR